MIAGLSDPFIGSQGRASVQDIGSRHGRHGMGLLRRVYGSGLWVTLWAKLVGPAHSAKSLGEVVRAKSYGKAKG